jgi:catechol 2,3-dioxygenase-like lactoylglutathione lyase family enzyme
MQLNHTNITVPDIDATADFFIRFFGLRRAGGRDEFLTLLQDEDGFTLTVMRPGKGEIPAYPKAFHIGFFVADATEVRNKHAELTNVGVKSGKVSTIDRGGPTTLFYTREPGGIMVEVAAHGQVHVVNS